MTDFTTKIASREDLQKISKFIVRICSNQELQCIQTSIGETAISLENELLELLAKDEIVCVFAENSLGKACGFLACEFDRESKRGWLKGPLAELNDEKIFQELFDLVVMELPLKIDIFFAFPNLRNSKLTDFYLKNEFSKGEISFIFEFKQNQFQTENVIEELFLDFLPKENESEFGYLHEEAFPNTYYSTKEILELVDKNHKILTMVKNNSLLGYIFLANDSDSEIADLEFIAIHKNFRGKGYGQKLITSALSYSFYNLNSTKVTLNVTNKNSKAKKLYEEIGFQLLCSGISLKRKN